MAGLLLLCTFFIGSELTLAGGTGEQLAPGCGLVAAGQCHLAYANGLLDVAI